MKFSGTLLDFLESAIFVNHIFFWFFFFLQDNLKVAEEKRLAADDKYLNLLGFVTTPRLYPISVWTNTSLPVIVSYLFDGDADQGVGLVRNVGHFLPNHTLLLYNLGLGRYDLQLVSTD